MMCVTSRGEPTILHPRPWREARTPLQALARRHALWLHAADVGLPDPVTRRVRPHTCAEIAELFGCATRTVQAGIRDARATFAAGGDRP